MSAGIVSDIDELRTLLRAERDAGRHIGVVPTMGALHDGHLSLVESAVRRTDFVVTTVFVNPTQFGPGEDFDEYPRDLERDVALASSAGARLVFAPAVDAMYPRGEQTRVSVLAVSRGLCGAHRPGHFEGVSTIVSKLFNLLGPGTYFFGAKDYQQLRVIEALARDLFFPVEVVACPIVRESDGLAMSSRNTYLSPEAREQAPALARGLQSALSAYCTGERRVEALLETARAPIAQTPFRLEYLELRGRDQLETLDVIAPDGRLERPAVLLVAAEIDGTRLIDNVVLDPATPPLLRGTKS